MSTIDREIFDKIKERMKTKFPILLEGFLRDAKKYLVTAGSNLPSGDIVAIIEATHSLKSASGLLGITDVHDFAEKLEYAGKNLQSSETTNFESLNPIYENLQNSFLAVEDTLLAELEKAKAT